MVHVDHCLRDRTYRQASILIDGTWNLFQLELRGRGIYEQLTCSYMFAARNCMHIGFWLPEQVKQHCFNKLLAADVQNLWGLLLIAEHHR